MATVLKNSVSTSKRYSRKSWHQRMIQLYSVRTPPPPTNENVDYHGERLYHLFPQSLPPYNIFVQLFTRLESHLLQIFGTTRTGTLIQVDADIFDTWSSFQPHACCDALPLKWRFSFCGPVSLLPCVHEISYLHGSTWDWLRCLWYLPLSLVFWRFGVTRGWVD